MVLNLLIDNPAIRIIGPQVFPFMRVVKLVRYGVNITNIFSTKITKKNYYLCCCYFSKNKR